ncbi:MAG: glycoside hydrolase family 3 C-terminal domain-containing protein [Candidatus Marinimicrobia bacterium]|nr:glycoside hydrolase family 3 C-terminal domain-containing protein [Candidatus Neomarinimicrobiota bacterium]
MNFTQSLMIVVMSFMVLISGCQKGDNLTIDIEVKKLISQMTLEEKIGQMTQLTIDSVSKVKGTESDLHQIDLAKLEEAIIEYHISSILNVYDAAYTLDYWHEIINQIQDIATKKTRLGIPIIYGIDAIHGANYIVGATIFPQSIGMAATWNPELVRKEGEITATETRASGVPWNFNPVLGLGRQPLWPRLFETYGEDVYLASVMGAEYVKGLQGNDISNPEKVAACAKHYVGYSFPLSGKDRTPAWIPERMLRELFLPTFKSAIEAGAATVMVNSSEINGIPVHSSYYLLTEVLRNELGFDGFVVSDWNDINNLYLREKVAATQKEAVKMAVMAGVDMSMVPYDFSFYELLLELVNEGVVPEWRIDEAVTRILKVKFELGLFESPYPNVKLKKKFACGKFRKVNLQAAREAITLLKNDSRLLPLSKDKKIFITGPTANSLSVMNSGWTITWQGDQEDLYPKSKKTILQAVENKAGAKNVTYLPGVTFDKEIDINAAVKAARNSDVAIVCIGENPYCELIGNIDDLTMTQSQLKLAKAIEETGVPVVLVLVEGRPRIINGIVDDVDAILMAYLPGMEGGSAVADVLFGDFNPCGKLPITYPGYTNSLMCYDYKNSEISEINDYDAQFPFGYGLSYTKFEYSDLKLDKAEINESDELNVQVTVKNTGEITGKEVVQLYVSDLVASVTPSVKRLKRFSKILLEPEEAKTVNFTLYKDDLSFIGRENVRIVEPGEFVVSVADLTAQFKLK